MVEPRKRKSGTVYRVRRDRDGGLTATFENQGAANLQDALWGRWGARIPLLADREPTLPVTLRAVLLSRDTVDLTDDLLARLLSFQPTAGVARTSHDTLTVGEYIIEVFMPKWQAGTLPGGTSNPLAKKTVKEMKRGLNKIVFELEYEYDAKDNKLLDDDGNTKAVWGSSAIAWTSLENVRSGDILRLDARVRAERIGLEVWRKVRGFLLQMFEYAALDTESGYGEELRNPVAVVKAPPQSKPNARAAYLPMVFEGICTDFLELAAMADAGVRRVRGYDPGTPGGVPVPPTAERGFQAADLVELLALTSGRPAELLGATGRSVDVTRPGYLHIYQRNIDGEIVPGTKSAAYPEKWALLLGRSQETVARLSRASGPDGLLLPFPGTTRPWTEDEYERWQQTYFGPIARACGLGKDSDDPYSLRHFYATIRVAAGHVPQYIEASMGSSLATTTYNSIFRDLERLGKIGSYDIKAELAEARAQALADLEVRLKRRGLPMPKLSS